MPVVDVDCANPLMPMNASARTRIFLMRLNVQIHRPIGLRAHLETGRISSALYLVLSDDGEGDSLRLTLL